jgi:hypothetical protein
MLNTVFDIATKMAKLNMPETRMKPIRAASYNFGRETFFREESGF